jgi:hypothetical protein
MFCYHKIEWINLKFENYKDVWYRPTIKEGDNDGSKKKNSKKGC